MLVVKILYIRTSTEFDLLTIKLNRRLDSSNYRRRGRESRPKPRRQKRRETKSTQKIRRKGKMMKRVI